MTITTYEPSGWEDSLPQLLSGAEAVRRRPGFYGLNENQVAHLSDEELESIFESASFTPSPAAITLSGTLTNVRIHWGALAKLFQEEFEVDDQGKIFLREKPGVENSDKG